MFGYLWVEAAYTWCMLAYLTTPVQRGCAGEMAALLAAAEAWDARQWRNHQRVS